MTVPLQTQHDIREMDARGVPRARIARELGVSRNTVAKYADMEDMSPAPPFPAARPRPSLAGHEEWIDSVLAGDLGAPRRQRHTARRIYDRMVSERGCEGSYSSVCRHVAEWGRGRASAGDGFLELEWAPGTAQADYGNFEAVLAGRRIALKLLVLTLPHSNARSCVAGMAERAECLCDGLREIFEQVGRAPSTLVLDNATEAGRRLRGVVTESDLSSRFRAHYRCSSRYCNPYSGHEKGSVENAVGFLRRNLLVPVPEAPSLAEPDAGLAAGCARINADPSSRCRDGRPVSEAMAEDLAAMAALPATPFDAVRWLSRKSDGRGHVAVDGRLYLAGPAWHDRRLTVGVRAATVEVLADRGRRVAELPRAFGEGEPVRSPLSLVPALVARPRAFSESPIRRDMPPALVEAIDRLDATGRRRVLRAISRAAESSGFAAARGAAARALSAGRVPGDAEVDMAARRIAAGEPGRGGADLSVYDGLVRGEAL